jgi:integrase
MSVFKPKYRDKTGELVAQNVWWYEFTFCGRRIRESAKTTRKTIAIEGEKSRRLELEKTLSGMPSENREQRIRTVGELVGIYQDHYGINHRPNSVIWTRTCAAHLKQHLGSALLPDVTETAIRAYIRTRLDESASGRSINMELGELSRAIGKPWSALWPRVRKLEERKDIGRALAFDEERRLLDAIPSVRSPLIGPFIRTDLLTGMRCGEILDLTWEQADLAKRVITVGHAKTSSGTGRQIPMNEALFGVLSAHAAWFTERFGATRGDYYLFPWGSPYPSDPRRATTTIKTAWKQLRKAAGVSCRLHDLRHTVATRMAESGVPESTMLSLLGHMSRSMLERYSHIRMAAKRQAVESLTLANVGGISNGVPKESPKVSKKATLQ